MPVLDDDGLARMKEFNRECSICKKTVGRNYCRQCDEFYETGHKENCVQAKTAREHQGHRTY